MKITSEDVLLNATGAVMAAKGLMLAAGPGFAQKMADKMYLKAPHTAEEMFGSDGLGMGMTGLLCAHAGAHSLALALNKEAKSKTKRNALKINGVTLLTMATINGVYVSKGICRKDIGSVGVGLSAALGAASLALGLKKDED